MEPLYEEIRKSMSPEELKQLLQLGKDQLSTNETFLLRNADKKNDAEMISNRSPLINKFLCLLNNKNAKGILKAIEAEVMFLLPAKPLR